MITRPLISVYLDRVRISPRNIEDVAIFNSIDMTLPELTFKIADLDGTFLSQLDIYVGATIGVDLIESNQRLESNNIKGRTFTDFIITKIFDGFENNNESLGGFIQIWCKPAWYLFGNNQGHAYAPMKLSELIKKVCQEAHENLGLKIEDSRFASSSDPGNVPRFKCCESDLDFIEKKLLPYTNIDDSNVFFYVDWFGRPNLTSFERLISQEPKTIIYPPAGLANTIQEKLSDIVKQKGITEAYSWQGINLKIGDENLKKAFSTIKKKVFLENNETGKVYIANQQPRARMGSDNGKTFASKMPFNALTMEYIDATSSEPYPNRLLPDALAMARNSDNNVVDFIQLEVLLNGAIDKMVVGDTVMLVTPIRKISMSDNELVSKKNSHWINGKWLIKNITMTQRKCNPDDVSTKITVIRPTLIYNIDTTTINKSSYLYSVE